MARKLVKAFTDQSKNIAHNVKSVRFKTVAINAPAWQLYIYLLTWAKQLCGHESVVMAM